MPPAARGAASPWFTGRAQKPADGEVSLTTYWVSTYEFNANYETEVDEFDHHVENVPYATILYHPSFLPLLTTHITVSADHGGRRLQPIPSPVAR